MHQLHPNTTISSKQYSRRAKYFRPANLFAQCQAVDVLRCRIARHRTEFRAAFNSDGRSSCTSHVDRTLYGSRVADGQQLLRLLLEAPDINEPFMSAGGSSFSVSINATPASPRSEGPLVAGINTPLPALDTPSPMAADSAASHVLSRVAALVREVAALMVSHRDMSTLLNAMNTCQTRVNAARVSGSAGGGAKSPEQRARSGFGRNPSWSSISGAKTTPTLPMSSSIPASKGMAMVPGSGETPLSPEPNQAARDPLHSGEALAEVTSTLATAPSGAATDVLGTLCRSGDDEWDWRQVRRVVVIGLGSLGAYQAALRSGRQTERESSRASSRLYQLALSLVLASPSVLPGLLDAVRPSAAASSPAVPAAARATEAQSSEISAPAGQWTDASEVREAAPTQSVQATTSPSARSDASKPPPAASSPLEPAAAAAARAMPAVALQGAAAAAAGDRPRVQAMGNQVQYFDTEYLEWDIRLIQSLWPGPDGDNMGALPRAQVRETIGESEAWRRQGQVGMVTVNDPVTQGIIAAAAAGTVAPPAALAARTPTLFYAPCCPRDLYDEIVQQNLAAGTLHNVALIGNSLRAQAETALLLRAFGGTGMSAFAMSGVGGRGGTGIAGRGAGWGIDSKGKEQGALGEDGSEAFVDLVSSGRVVEVMLPDFAAHGVATAVHLFL